MIVVHLNGKSAMVFSDDSGWDKEIPEWLDYAANATENPKIVNGYQHVRDGNKEYRRKYDKEHGNNSDWETMS